MAGKTLKELNFTEEIWTKYWAVKESVFPFNKIRRPGHFAFAGNAFHRRGHGPRRRSRHGLREIADGGELAAAARGKVFISVSDLHKKDVAEVARQFADLGFELIATGGTAAILEKAGLKVRRILKLQEGRPNVIDLLKNKEIQLVINTPAGAVAARGRSKNPHHRSLYRHAHHDHVERRESGGARHRRAKKIRLLGQDGAGISLNQNEIRKGWRLVAA